MKRKSFKTYSILSIFGLELFYTPYWYIPLIQLATSLYAYKGEFQRGGRVFAVCWVQKMYIKMKIYGIIFRNNVNERSPFEDQIWKDKKIAKTAAKIALISDIIINILMVFGVIVTIDELYSN